LLGLAPIRSHQVDLIAFVVRQFPSESDLVPNLTPIRPTFTLALELSTGFTHASAALRAHAIQNAGHHIGTRLGCIYSDEPHTHLRSQEASTLLMHFLCQNYKAM
jgi:hypothetical protein